MFRLEDVTFKDILHITKQTISQDQVTCITGPSGSGKSTLLRLLNHLISPTSGRILYRDTDLREMHPQEIRQKIVMIPQTPVMFDGTIKENLLAGVAFANVTEPDDTTLRHLLDGLHLTKELSDPIDHLSGGEKQRIAIGRGLLMAPEVVLLDEPTSALDEDTATTIMQLVMSEAKKSTSSIVMVTHDEELVSTFADQIMEIGKKA